MTATYRGDSLDKLDRHILLALDGHVRGAKDICHEWALPESDASRVRYRIRERLGRGEERLVQIYEAEETPGGINDRNLYSLTPAGEDFVRTHREELSTPKDIDALHAETSEIRETVEEVGRLADDALDVSTSQRERVNDLQSRLHDTNDRSKENRKRLQKLEREVFENEWGDPSLRTLIDEVEAGSVNRDEDIEHDLNVKERKFRREFVPRKEFREARQAAEKGVSWARSLSEEVTSLREALAEERQRNEELEQRLAEVERALAKPGGIKGFLFG